MTGATGNQGGAVARHLLSNGFRVILLTRDPASKKAEQLQHPMATIVKGDLNEPDSYSQHLKNVDGVFSVQAMQPKNEKEIWQGITLADRAKDARVPHFIYSSTNGADRQTGIPHWDSKGRIEEHVRNSGLAYTILRPVSLFENFLIPQVKSRIPKGKLITPTKKDIRQQLIASDDVGKMAAKIFENPQPYRNQTLPLATEEMTMEEVAQQFSAVLGKKVTYGQLPIMMVRVLMGNALYKMFDYLNQHDDYLVKDFEAAKKQIPNPLTLKEWIGVHFK